MKPHLSNPNGMVMCSLPVDPGQVDE